MTVMNNKYINNFINIANMCINFGFWLLYFKNLISIIISKPSKLAYDPPKMFHFIVLLNTFRKLIEKVISEEFKFNQLLIISFTQIN